MFATLYRTVTACMLSMCMAYAAVAQESTPFTPDQLTGTLKKIKDKGAVTIGYREKSVPFAFLDPKGQPVGYSVDLCNAIVEEIVDELGGMELKTEYRPVMPENRFALLAAGDIDLECGSSTDNLERRKQVAFSPTIFVTGTKLLVKKDGPIKALSDLKGKTVVVTRGTTNAAAMKTLSQRQKLGITFVEGGDHQESFDIFTSGKADAFANDDVLLYAMIADTQTAGRYRVVGDFLSYDPYGIVFRKDDPQIAQAVDRAFRRLAESGEIIWVYDKWFLKRLPSGVRLNLPMSAQLEETFRVLGLPSH